MIEEVNMTEETQPIDAETEFRVIKAAAWAERDAALSAIVPLEDLLPSTPEYDGAPPVDQPPL